MQDIKQPLAIAVRKARKEHGLSQEKLAETIKIDTRTILNIEAGRGNCILRSRSAIGALINGRPAVWRPPD